MPIFQTMQNVMVHLTMGKKGFSCITFIPQKIKILERRFFT